MENYIEFVSVPAIAAVVFAVMDVIKYAVNNSKFNRYIPLLSALLGAACGIICYYALPDIIPAHNVVAALVIGGASGLTATGTHQLVKQLGKSEHDADQTKDTHRDANNDGNTKDN